LKRLAFWLEIVRRSSLAAGKCLALNGVVPSLGWRPLGFSGGPGKFEEI